MAVVAPRLVGASWLANAALGAAMQSSRCVMCVHPAWSTALTNGPVCGGALARAPCGLFVPAFELRTSRDNLGRGGGGGAARKGASNVMPGAARPPLRVRKTKFYCHRCRAGVDE